VFPKEQVERFRPVDTADLVHVAEPFRRDQGGPGAAALDDGVDHHRRAMDENGGALDISARVGDGGQDSLDQGPWLRSRFPQGERARFLIQDGHVRESPADVNGDAQGTDARLVSPSRGGWLGRH